MAFLVGPLLLKYKNKKCVMPGYPRGTNLMILQGKWISSDPPTRITLFSQMLALVLTGTERVLRPFWNDACLDISQRLWLPTEIDSADSRLSSLNTSLLSKKSNSWFWMKNQESPEMMSSPKTFSPSYMFIHAEKWVPEDIRARKIRIYPNPNQRIVLRKWFNTTRYVFNRALEAVNKREERPNFMTLRNKFVTAKNNPLVKEWETETPKDIRAGGLRDLEKAFKTCFSNLKNNNITNFKVRFRSKRNGDASLEIPKSAVSLKSSGISLFPRFISGPIRTSKDKSLKDLKIEYDCRLQMKNDQWFLIVPYKQQGSDKIPPFGPCALDPGVRTFQTVYSENKVQKISVDKQVIKKLQDKLDLFRSLRDRKIIKKSSLKRREKKILTKLQNLIDDMHYQTIKKLTDEYQDIFLPNFESQEIARKNKFGNRNLLQMRHFAFKERLKSKCELLKRTHLTICTEEFTSKTCGRCGKLNNSLGSSEIFTCPFCALTIDRDINGARNILIKNIMIHK